MAKRFGMWVAVAAMWLLGAGFAANVAKAASQYPDPSKCSTTPPALSTGTDPGFPGLWWNPNRYGTGWDFLFNSTQSQAVIYWYTYNAAGQPVWLSNTGTSPAPVTTAANGNLQIYSTLQLITLTPGTTPVKSIANVGQVWITFAPGSTTAASVIWQWNAVGASPQPQECVYNFVHGPQSPAGSSTPVTPNSSVPLDESYTGNWFANSEPGWGLNITVGIQPNGSTSEIDTAAIYDTAGNPVWLENSSNPQSTPTTAATTILLGYYKSNYPGGFPLSNCTTTSCRTPTSNATTYVNRSFVSSSQGSAVIAANIPAATTGAAPVAWPNTPWYITDSSGNLTLVPITKLTEQNYVAVNQTACPITPPATTCGVTVSWISASSAARVYKRNLLNGTIASTPIASSSSGSIVDNLSLGADVQYELRDNGSPTGTLLYQSAEVRPVPGPMTTTTVDPVPTHDATVGTMAGQASTDGGSAQYHVPIVVPPGRAGMEPHLSLDYNSRAGNGVMGMGWTISGLSSIHRCPQTPEQDGHTVGVSYTSNDRLCLDGQRLVNVSGSYGSSQTIYSTEVDSHARIIQVGGTGLADNTACFRVEQKDGRILHYGGVISGNLGALTCTITAGNNSRVLPNGVTPLSWLVEKVEDRVGNNELYTYVASGQSGEVNIAQIAYTGFNGTGAVGDRTVNFAYQARTTTAGVTDIASSYLAGGLSMQTQELASITTKIGATTVRTYTPTYKAATYNARLMMTSLKECATNNGITACHPATTFAYNDAATPSFAFGAMSNINSAIAAVMPGGLAQDAQAIGDLDGDGTREIAVTAVTFDPDTTHTFLAQATADGKVQGAVDLTGTGFMGNLGNLNPGYGGVANYADIDGDGRSELVLIPPAGGTLQFGQFNFLRGTVAASKVSSGASPATNFATLFTTYTAYVNSTSTPLTLTSAARVYAADIDGDGRTDLIVADTDATNCPNGLGVSVHLNNFQGKLGSTPNNSSQPVQAVFKPAQHLFCLQVYQQGSLGVFYQYIDHIGDFNGDGLPDFYISEITQDPSTRISSGYLADFWGVKQTQVSGGTVSTVDKQCGGGLNGLSASECQTSTGTNVRVIHWMDVNGDGLEDFVTAVPGGDWIIHLNTGGAFGGAIDTGSSTGTIANALGNAFRYADKAPTMDVDGDGRPDLLIPASFALKMCTTVVVPVNSTDNTCPTGAVSGSAPSVNLAGNAQCFAYSCPEDPQSGTLNMPKNAGGDPGGFKYAWKDEFGNGEPAYGMYSDATHPGAQDLSAYVMNELKFVQTDATHFVVSSLPTSVVTRLSGSPISTPHSDDLYGSGLASMIATVGCPLRDVTVNLSQGTGTATHAPCAVVTDSANKYGPWTMPDGTLASTFEPTVTTVNGTTTINLVSTLYNSKNAGVPYAATSATSSLPSGLYSCTNVTPKTEIPGLLQSATNGLGDTAMWDYDTLASASICSQDGVLEYSVTGDYADSHHYYFASTMPVVAAMVQSNGLGTFDGARSAIYSYNQAMYNHLGRGFQGFYSIGVENASSTIDAARRLLTTTVFNQKFPLAGTIANVNTYLAASAALSLKINATMVRRENDTYGCEQSNGSASTCPIGDALPLATAANGYVYQPVLTAQTVRDSDLLTGGLYANASTSNTWDTSGNLTSQTVTRGDNGSPVFIDSHTTTTTNVYAPNGSCAAAGDAGSWWIDKLCHTQVTTSVTYDPSRRSLPSGTALPGSQTATVDYTWNSDRTPLTKTVQSGISNQQSTTTYNYAPTSYGLPASVVVNAPDLGAGLSPTRTTYFAYTKGGTSVESDGYFAYQVTKAVSGSTTQVTTTAHEPNDGQVTVATAPNGVRSTTTYDPFGRATNIAYTDNTGVTYASPMQIAYSRCAGGTCSVSGANYGEDGHETYAAYKVTTVQAGYPTKVGWFDLLGREIKSAERGYLPADPFVETLTVYDASGTVSEKVAPFYQNGSASYFTSYTYDALNRVILKDEPRSDMGSYGDFMTSYVYSGRTTTVYAYAKNLGIPASSGACSVPNLCVSMTRSQNALGQYMETKDANNGLTDYWTEPNGHVALIEDTEGNVIQATYDPLGRRTSSNDPDQGVWQFGYDAFGELNQQTDARQVTMQVTQRDGLGRPLFRQQTPASSSTTGYSNESLLDGWTYDNGTNGIGALASVKRWRAAGAAAPSSTGTPVWQESYAYDNAGRVNNTTTSIAESTSQTITTGTAYDSYGRLDSHTYLSGLVVQTQYGPYGQMGALANKTTGQVYWEATSMDPWHKVTGESYADGTTGTMVNYQSTGQEQSASWTLKGATVDSLAYTYDSFGNLTSQTRTTAGQSSDKESYTYDVLQRLAGTSRTLAGAAAVSYTYSASGNITSKSDFSANTYSYAATNTRSSTGCGPHAVSGVGSTSYSCDANGNVYGGALQAAYDADNHPRSVTRNGVTMTWAYDANGNRDYETSSAGVRYYGPAGYEQIGITSAVHELGPLIVTRTASGDTITTALVDRLGSTIETIDNGTVAANMGNSRGYDAFGKVRWGNLADKTNGTLTLPKTIHGFTKHEHADDVQILHMGGRIFDYSLGRFLNVDPFIQKPLSSQGINPYSYVGNNPLSGRDPTGYLNVCDTFIACRPEQINDPMFNHPIHIGTSTRTTQSGADIGSGPKGPSSSPVDDDAPPSGNPSNIGSAVLSIGSKILPNVAALGKSREQGNWSDRVRGFGKTLVNSISAFAPPFLGDDLPPLQIADKEVGGAAAGDILAFLGVMAGEGTQLLRGMAAMDEMASFTAAGADVFHGPGLTRIGSDLASTNVSENVARIDGVHDVVVHGALHDDAGAAFMVDGLPTNANQIADAVRGNPSWNGQPIRLLTCFGGCGASSPAQEISNILKVPVQGATDAVGVARIPNSAPVVRNGGIWHWFEPQ